MRITELYLYPVKSCRGIAVSSVRVGRRGPAGDRRFMVVDRAGEFITQRQEPRLALVDAAFAGDRLVLSTGHEEITVPRAPTDGPEASVRVWGSKVRAIEVADGSSFFTTHLERPARLVYMPDESERAVNPERSLPGDIVSFADAYPLLLISQESLDGLNARLAEPLTMSRFRPNVVIGGGVAHGEDDLESFRMGKMTFRNVKPCERCSMTSVDASTAKRGKEPLRTLGTYRKWDGQVWFGTNLIHDGEGELAVGDPVTPF
ncbi:MAG: MOSC domain-containing protein [Deltaproteobacteria bacterium]|nr:MAG: MOSC domain-containing protein [Deltaproteobacteria bacterium]